MLLKRRAFSYIELLVTLMIIAICIIPVVRMFSVLIGQVYASGEMTTAMYLAQEGMEKLKNLGFTKAQILAIGDIYDPPLTQPPLVLNKNKWRALRHLEKGTDPLEVRIQVFNARNLNKSVIELVTLIEDLEWSGQTTEAQE